MVVVGMVGRRIVRGLGDVRRAAVVDFHVVDVEDQPVEIGIGAVRIRAAAMWAIAAVATLLVLREAAPVLVPILVSILLAYALEPAVGALVRCRLPRVLAASIVYVVLAIAIGAAVQKLRGPVNAFLDDLPNTIAAMRDAFAAHDDGGPGPIDRLDETAKTLHEATTAATPAPGWPMRLYALVDI